MYYLFEKWEFDSCDFKSYTYTVFFCDGLLSIPVLNDGNYVYLL